MANRKVLGRYCYRMVKALKNYIDLMKMVQGPLISIHTCFQAHLCFVTFQIQ